MPQRELCDPLQQAGRIVHAFATYQYEAELEIARWERNYAGLHPRYQALIPGQPVKHLQARKAMYRNAEFLDDLVAAAEVEGPSQGPADKQKQNGSGLKRPSPHDVDKVRYVLKNLVRDWSAEGAAERSQSYGRMLTELSKRLGPASHDQPPPSVLVPGAGLGRLCVELGALGYHAQGNEFSYYMLLTSAFVLNCMTTPEQYMIHPWLHTNCNQFSDEDQLRAVSIPDRTTIDMLPRPGCLSMVAGDFVEVYSMPAQAEAFDAVATCFFIDTAHNIFEYIDVIWHTLKMGGFWVNLGPLLYHWADAHTYLPGEEISIELCLKDVLRIAQAMGFQLLHKEMVPAAFNVNLKSMLRSSYSCVFWTMVKIPRGASAASQRSSNQAAQQQVAQHPQQQ